MREKTPPSLLVVTLIEGEEQGIYTAASKELVNIIEARLKTEVWWSSRGTKNPQSGRTPV